MNKYIQKLISEQFSVGDLDFSDDDQEYGINIFNKDTKYIEIYNNILDNNIGKVSKDDIGYMNGLISVINVKNRSELLHITRFYTYYYPDDSLNWLNVSNVANMAGLFRGDTEDDIDKITNIKNEYNGDISQWDVSHVTNMSWMFCNSVFNRDISEWDVSGVTNMCGMFADNDDFNQDISKWDVSHVTNMFGMFQGTIFNYDLSGWDVSNVTDMSWTFFDSHFKHDISMWDVSSVVNYDCIFTACLLPDEYKPAKFRK